MLTFVLCWCAVKLPSSSSVIPNEPTMLPLEVKEMLLMKTIAALYKFLRVRLMPRADVISLITMVTVCFEWYVIITGRKFNLHQLRQMLRTTVIHKMQHSLYAFDKNTVINVNTVHTLSSISHHWLFNLTRIRIQEFCSVISSNWTGKLHAFVWAYSLLRQDLLCTTSRDSRRMH